MDGLQIWIQLGTGIVMISNVIGLVLVDSYSESNFDTRWPSGGSTQMYGQSFEGVYYF
jgi:hypothetical protein